MRSILTSKIDMGQKKDLAASNEALINPCTVCMEGNGWWSSCNFNSALTYFFQVCLSHVKQDITCKSKSENICSETEAQLAVPGTDKQNAREKIWNIKPKNENFFKQRHWLWFHFSYGHFSYFRKLLVAIKENTCFSIASNSQVALSEILHLGKLNLTFI